MAEAIVKTNEIKLNGREFWRGGAESIQLADVGEIRTPLLQPSWFEAKDRIAARKVKVKNLGTITIDSTRTSKVDFLGKVDLAKVFPLGQSSLGYEAVVSRQLELMYFEIDTDDMVRAVNDSPAIREKLKGWGEDARVCTGVFLVVKAETSKHFAVNTSHEAEFTVHGVTIKPKLTVGVSGDTSISLQKGSCFGYAIAKPIWDDPKPKNAKRLQDLRFDNHT